MKFLRVTLLGSFVILFLLSGCQDGSFLMATVQPGKNIQSEQPYPVAPGETNVDGIPLEESNIPSTAVEFNVTVPEETEMDDEIYLTILDEVTGLYLNSQKYAMTFDEETGSYSASMPFPADSVVKYRYERQTDELLVAEHNSDGTPVRYRQVAVSQPSSIEDVVSRWTNTEYNLPSGRIMGQVVDAVSGLPLPNVLVTMAGAQVFSTADGSFLIDGIPAGIHNLVAFSPDGAYQTFQQGAEIAADSTTPAQIAMDPAKLVNVTFLVTPPANTPPLVPLRMAGNLSQLGNTFGTLTGGVSTLATRMPVLIPLPDGRYQFTIQLPVGADIRYKYTLGDGFWNAERNNAGDLRLRQLIVPDQDLTLTETIESWQTDPDDVLTFDLTVPESTPPNDFISLQLNPLFGWTEPFPMWHLGGNRWAYVLYGPLNLPGNLSYRYCRNNQCGVADDIETPGQFGPGRSVALDQLPKAFKDTVNGWVGLDQPVDAAALPAMTAGQQTQDFITGIETTSTYHPSFDVRYPDAWNRIAQTGANWLFLDPSWSVTTNRPPIFKQIAGSDPSWPDLISAIGNAHNQGLKVAINPVLDFTHLPQPQCDEEPCLNKQDTWWAGSTRDFSWWLQWFDRYRDFVIHFADMASASGADSLVLGGGSVNAALPGGVIGANEPSGVPADAEQRWRDLISEVRSRYSGPVIWSIPYQNGQLVPGFLDAVDGIYLEWTAPVYSSENPQPTVEELEVQFGTFLDEKIQPFQTSTGKPLTIGLKAESQPDLLAQQNTYQAAINAINARPWISGLVAQGYYLPAEIQDTTTSVHGKPAEYLLSEWFRQIKGTEPAP